MLDCIKITGREEPSAQYRSVFFYVYASRSYTGFDCLICINKNRLGTSQPVIQCAAMLADKPNHTPCVAVAPMMGCTDRHFRYLARLLAPHARLFTEMVVAQALLHGQPERWLSYHPHEHPLALQVGGSDPKLLAECARMAAAYGFDEINLNVGCPSDRVQRGRIGACLFLEPALVAECVESMKVAGIPVSVKMRIGVDNCDDLAALLAFTDQVVNAGCEALYVHARKAWLQGLSPKENRSVPPLCYERVYAVKAAYPDLPVIINGGIETVADVKQHLQHVDGVMLGRAAYHNPYCLAQIEAELFGTVMPNRLQIVRRYMSYVEQQLENGARFAAMARHLLGLFQGIPGAKHWRRALSARIHQRGADTAVLEQAMSEIVVSI